jgi:hypothetical protein
MRLQLTGTVLTGTGSNWGVSSFKGPLSHSFHIDMFIDSTDMCISYLSTPMGSCDGSDGVCGEGSGISQV